MRATPAHSREVIAPQPPELFPLPLVGRQAELATLVERLAAVRRGTGSTTLVAGVGGVGKSRLVGALSERAAAQDWTVALGRAYPVETGVPFAVFSDALAPIVRGLTPASLS